jgi:hypothetical protein
MSHRVMRLAITLTMGCALACAGPIAVAGATAFHKTAHKRSHRLAHRDRHSVGAYPTALNVALAGTATASTAASGSPGACDI